MPSDAIALAERGIEAWRRGDFESLEALLDPAVEWHAIEPGEWDCHSRDEVMRTLRERYEQGFTRGPLDLGETGRPEVLVLVSRPRETGGPEWPEETATLLTFSGDRVVEMRDFPTRGDALRAAQ